jgi:hypothetical protein
MGEFDTAVMPPRRTRRNRVRTVLATPTVDKRFETDKLKNPRVRKDADPPKYPGRGQLSAEQRDVMNLLTVRPRGTTEIADALNIEWPTAAHTIVCLRRRGLAVEVSRRPSVWGPA